MPLPQRVSSTALPAGFWTVVVTTLLLSCCNNLRADIVKYTFDGEIPVGATDTHSEINIGETWVAWFFVDTTTPDEEPDPSFGFYDSAVISGSLTFSGGYTSPFDFAAADVTIANDFQVVDDILDAVQVSNENGDNVFQFITTDLSSLMSDSFPMPGTNLSPFPNVIDNTFFQLRYSDSNGFIGYTTDVANNVSFSATAVPEPSSFLAILLVTLPATLRRRK